VIAFWRGICNLQWLGVAKIKAGGWRGWWRGQRANIHHMYSKEHRVRSCFSSACSVRTAQLRGASAQ